MNMSLAHVTVCQLFDDDFFSFVCHPTQTQPAMAVVMSTCLWGIYFIEKKHKYILLVFSLYIYIYIYIFTHIRVSQKFCNILVYACLLHLYHITEAVQAMEGTDYGW